MNTAVKSAVRVLDLLEAFAQVRRPMSLSEIAAHIGAPMSSCHGLVRTLQARGYLYATVRRLVYPTRCLFDVARTILEHDPILERIEPELASLRDATGETVILGKREGRAVVYLEVVEGTRTIRYTARPGERKPLHSSAIGKALLGALPERALDGLLAELELPRVTARTLTERHAVAADVRAGRRRGYFVTRGENVADVMAVAICLTVNDEPYGIAVAGPLQRMEPRLEEVAARLAGTRRALSCEGGGR